MMIWWDGLVAAIPSDLIKRSKESRLVSDEDGGNYFLIASRSDFQNEHWPEDSEIGAEAWAGKE